MKIANCEDLPLHRGSVNLGGKKTVLGKLATAGGFVMKGDIGFKFKGLYEEVARNTGTYGFVQAAATTAAAIRLCWGTKRWPPFPDPPLPQGPMGRPRPRQGRPPRQGRHPRQGGQGERCLRRQGGRPH